MSFPAAVCYFGSPSSTVLKRNSHSTRSLCFSNSTHLHNQPLTNPSLTITPFPSLPLYHQIYPKPFLFLCFPILLFRYTLKSYLRVFSFLVMYYLSCPSSRVLRKLEAIHALCPSTYTSSHSPAVTNILPTPPFPSLPLCLLNIHTLS